MKIWDDRELPPLGMGCWAIGGEFWAGDQPLGWGKIDDIESKAAIHKAIDLGVRYFDTADVYGCGHSETVVGDALSGITEDILVSTKFGNAFDTATKQMSGSVVTPAAIRAAVEASLKRLRRDRIDLLFFHVNEHPVDQAAEVFATLQHLRQQGLIDRFGWSTDDPVRAAAHADLDGYVAVQHNMNLFIPANDIVQQTQQRGLLSVARQPLAMGLLSGRFTANVAAGFDPADIRSSTPEWQAYFDDGRPNQDFLDRVASVRDLLTEDGRTLVQGVLAWFWAKGPHIVPIPGFRTAAQVTENAGAIDKGPLSATAVAEIHRQIGA